MLHSVVIVHHEVVLADDILSSGLLFRQIICLNSNVQFMLLSHAFHAFELFLVVQIVLDSFALFQFCLFVDLEGWDWDWGGLIIIFVLVSLPLLVIQKFFLYLFSFIFSMHFVNVMGAPEAYDMRGSWLDCGQF